MSLAAVAWVVLGAGCKKSGDDAEKVPAAKADDAAATETGAKQAAAVPAPEPEQGPIPWIQDDYAGALAKARERGVPVVIDMWAPWCHTCISMQAYVLSHPTLTPLVDRFVWLQLDTDKASSASAVAALPVSVWPTFYVVTPAGDEGEKVQVQAQHLNAASLTQFRELLMQGEQGHLDTLAKGGKLSEGSPLAHVRRADRAVVAGDFEAADEAYVAALAAGGPEWSRRPEVLVSLARVKYVREDWAGCIELARTELARAAAAANASVVSLADYALSCAQGEDKETVADLYLQASRALTLLLLEPDAALSIDDRSEALRVLREIAVIRGREEEAQAHAEKQRELLDRAMAEAPNAFIAMGYMWPRAEVYTYLGRAAELIDEYAAIAKQLPDQYDPPYRLAWVLLKGGQHDKALVAANKALSMVYGPRKARVQEFIAEIHADRGDREAERAARVAVVEILESLAPGHAPAGKLEAARKALAKLDEASE